MNGISARARCCCELLAVLLAACAPGDETYQPAPVVPSGTGDASGPSSVGSGAPQPPDDACEPSAASGTQSDAGETSGGVAFKFDVGAPDGSVGFSLSCDDIAMAPSNLGCTFWAIDLPNDEQGTKASPPAADQPFSVVVANVSALTDAHIEVFLGSDTMPLHEATVAPTETWVFDLGEASIAAGGSSTGGLAFRIDSDVPIAAYQFNPAANLVEVYSNDASLLLPENALGADYTAATADAILLGSSTADPDPINAGAFVAVVATVDGTTVEFFPTATQAGDGFEQIVLDRGQVATIVSDALGVHAGNLSGTRVHADAPVAVFSGNVATAIPVSSDTCCADHVEHQLFPMTAWGHAYAVAPPSHPEGKGDARAFYRILAADQGASLVWCPTRPGNAPTSLDAFEGAWFETDAPFTVRSDDREQSFSVVQYLLSNTELGDSGLGDPAMIVIPPAAQHEQRSVFVVPAGYVASWATVVVRGGGEVHLDGAPLGDDDFNELGVLFGVTHRYLHIPLDAGTHTLEAEGPAGVTVTGVDEAVGYGFAGGSGLRVLAIPPAAG